LVIDLSPYWRPPGFAAAVVVVDALVCEGAGDALVESLQWDANHAQFLLRALLFRAITDLLHRPHEEPGTVTRPYQPPSTWSAMADPSTAGEAVGHDLDRRPQRQQTWVTGTSGASIC